MKNEFMITCSVGKGVMTSEDCLKCAQHMPTLCGFDYSLLNSVYATMEVRPDIHVTDLTTCLLKSWFTKKHPKAEAPHEMLARYIGTAIHKDIGKDNDISMSEVTVKYKDVIGTADRLYLKDGRLIDYKTARGIYLGRLPYGNHETQLNMYAYMLEKSGYEINSMALQYISLSGPTMCRKCRRSVVWSEAGFVCPACGKSYPKGHLGVYTCEVVRYSNDEIEEVFEARRKELSSALKKNKRPSAEPGWICGYCSYLADCEEGLAFGFGEKE